MSIAAKCTCGMSSNGLCNASVKECVQFIKAHEAINATPKTYEQGYTEGWDACKQAYGKGAVWVKASERLPEKDGYYCFKANGGYMGAYLRTASNGSRWFCDSAGGTIRNWKNCEWLDESGTAAGREEDDPQELWDEHSVYIDDNIDDLSYYAGKEVMTKESFFKLFRQQKEK